MTRITDRELELQAEVEWLRKLVSAVSPINPSQLIPDQLKAWREEYRERAVTRVLLDEAERARDEIALRRKEIEQLREERNGWGGRAQEAEAELVKAREEIERLRNEQKNQNLLFNSISNDYETQLAKAREALERITRNVGKTMTATDAECVWDIARQTLKELDS